MIATSTLFRVLLIGLLLVALWSPGIYLRTPAINLMILNDYSLSVDTDTAYQHWQGLSKYLSSLPEDSRIALAHFADNVTPAAAVQYFKPSTISGLKKREFYSGTSDLNRTGTNIESALTNSTAGLTGSTPNAIIVLTDGGQTQGDADDMLDSVIVSE